VGVTTNPFDKVGLPVPDQTVGTVGGDEMGPRRLGCARQP
jgi:hypothetical protein